jgi:hypothetical protein
MIARRGRRASAKRACDGVGYGRAHNGARGGAHGQTLFVLFKRDVARLENTILLIPHLIDRDILHDDDRVVVRRLCSDIRQAQKEYLRITTGITLEELGGKKEKEQMPPLMSSEKVAY